MNDHGCECVSEMLVMLTLRLFPSLLSCTFPFKHATLGCIYVCVCIIPETVVEIHGVKRPLLLVSLKSYAYL